jgi:hypothetical protein
MEDSQYFGRGFATIKTATKYGLRGVFVKFNKKIMHRLVIAAALLLSTVTISVPLATTTAATSVVQAAARPDQEPVKVYPLSGRLLTAKSVTLFDLAGNITGVAKADTAYPVYAVAYVNGLQLLKLGTDSQWILAREGTYFPGELAS